MGVPVQGGVCVKSTPKNNTDAAALYIVGGKSNSSDYQGLQRFTFETGVWETIKPTVPVTQDRLYHNSVYLNASDSLLVFAGTQDGTQQASSQTFTILASEPYTVTAYEAIAPPAISPILMQYSESKAIYLGGSDSNTKAMLFSPSQSWFDSNATLANPISYFAASIINGDDGSKSLYTFDMSVSPNVVNRTILIDQLGNPVTNAQPVVSRRTLNGFSELEDRSLEKRGNLTVENWPAYNSTLVPTAIRTACSLAQDQSGLTVISGGSTEDVLCIFKARDNSWVNATAKLASKTTTDPGTQISTSSSASSSAAAQVSVPATSNTDPATSGDHGKSKFSAKVLGAVVGSVVGVALIFIGVMIFLRWKRQRRHSEAGHQRRSSGIPEKSMDFSDRGLPQMISTRQFPGHQPQESAGSFSSVAILMGRVGHKRSGDNMNGSDGSSQFNQTYKTAISKPIPQVQVLKATAGPSREEKGISFGEEKEMGARPRTSTRGARRGSTRRSSGWNRYWSGGSGLNILGFGSKRMTYESDRSSESEYSEYRIPSHITQKSAVPPPLNLGDRPERPELNRVASGSPTIAYHNTKLPVEREMSGTIERSGSVSSMSSYNDDRHDAFSSGIPASVHENTWAPTDRQDWAIGHAQTTYSESNYQSSNTQSRIETHFPPPANSSRQPHTANYSSDMSWLNLGSNPSQRI